MIDKCTGHLCSHSKSFAFEKLKVRAIKFLVDIFLRFHSVPLFAYWLMKLASNFKKLLLLSIYFFSFQLEQHF